jgi:hypothetical protein
MSFFTFTPAIIGGHTPLFLSLFFLWFADEVESSCRQTSNAQKDTNAKGIAGTPWCTSTLYEEVGLIFIAALRRKGYGKLPFGLPWSDLL